MRYIHKTTEKFLNKELALDATGDEQDWAIEVADDERIDEYIRYYESSKRNDDIDFAMMTLIAVSFDEKIQGTNTFVSNELDYHHLFACFDYSINSIYNREILEYWEKIRKIIVSNKDLFRQIADSWSKSNPDEDPCASSLLYRDLMAKEFTVSESLFYLLIK